MVCLCARISLGLYRQIFENPCARMDGRYEFADLNCSFLKKMVYPCDRISMFLCYLLLMNLYVHKAGRCDHAEPSYRAGMKTGYHGGEILPDLFHLP